MFAPTPPPTPLPATPVPPGRVIAGPVIVGRFNGRYDVHLQVSTPLTPNSDDYDPGAVPPATRLRIEVPALRAQRTTPRDDRGGEFSVLAKDRGWCHDYVLGRGLPVIRRAGRRVQVRLRWPNGAVQVVRAPVVPWRVARVQGVGPRGLACGWLYLTQDQEDELFEETSDLQSDDTPEP